MEVGSAPTGTAQSTGAYSSPCRLLVVSVEAKVVKSHEDYGDEDGGDDGVDDDDDYGAGRDGGRSDDLNVGGQKHGGFRGRGRR